MTAATAAASNAAMAAVDAVSSAAALGAIGGDVDAAGVSACAKASCLRSLYGN